MRYGIAPAVSLACFFVACGGSGDGGSGGPGPGTSLPPPPPPPSVNCPLSDPRLSTSCVRHGDSITITGAGFGTKPSAAPWLWDDFEGGAANQPLSTGGWEHYWSASHPIYAGGGYASAQAAHTPMPRAADNFNTAGRKGLNTLEAYYSYRFRYDVVDGSFATDGAFIKLLRSNADPDFYRSNPRFYTSLFPAAGQVNAGYSDAAAGIDQIQWANADMASGTWHRLEVYYRYSNPAGTANGELHAWLNGQRFANYTNVVTRSAASSARVIDNFLLPFMADRLFNLALNVYVDDVYVDRTQARVEIGDASTWAQCTRREVQIPTAWSDGRIGVRVHRGSFAPGERAYLYVIDASGNAGAGIPLEFAP